MTRVDREEVREMIHDMLSGYHALITSQNDITNISLGEIKDHLKKLNGSVSEQAREIEELKVADVKHIVDCPAMPKIEALEKEIIGSWLRKHWKLALIIFLATLFVTNALVDFLGIKGILSIITNK
jgi:hypothetical protein